MEILRRVGVGTALMFGLLLPVDVAVAEDMTAAIQTGRMTVVEIDRQARRIVCKNGLGRLSQHVVTNEAKVASGEKTATDLSLLNTGDVIKAELRAGRIQRIVVLRHAWDETTSPEQ